MFQKQVLQPEVSPSITFYIYIYIYIYIHIIYSIFIISYNLIMITNLRNLPLSVPQAA